MQLRCISLFCPFQEIAQEDCISMHSLNRSMHGPQTVAVAGGEVTSTLVRRITSQESELVERLEPSLGQGQSEEGQGVEKEYERRQQSLQQLLSHPNHTSPRKTGAKSTDPDGVSVCLEFREQDTSTHSSTHSVNVFSVGALPFAPAGLRAASPPATPRSLWCPSPHQHTRPPDAVQRSVHIGDGEPMGTEIFISPAPSLARASSLCIEEEVTKLKPCDISSTVSFRSHKDAMITMLQTAVIVRCKKNGEVVREPLSPPKQDDGDDNVRSCLQARRERRQSGKTSPISMKELDIYNKHTKVFFLHREERGTKPPSLLPPSMPPTPRGRFLELGTPSCGTPTSEMGLETCSSFMDSSPRPTNSARAKRSSTY